MTTTIITDNGQYKTPGFWATTGAVIAGSAVQSAVSKSSSFISKPIIKQMKKTSQSCDNKTLRAAINDAFTNSKLAKNGVELLDVNEKAANKELREALLNSLPKFLREKGPAEYIINILENIFKNGNNAAYLPKAKKIVVNIGDDSLLVRISYNTIKINMKKYLVIALENKTYIANYIKTLGIFTSMIDKSSDGIIITRLTEGEYPKIIYVNNTTEKLTGLSRKTLINTNVTESVFMNHMEESSYIELCERLKHMNFAPFTCKYTKPNGEMCWLNLSIYPIGKNNIIESLSKIDDTHSVVEITALELCDIDLYITIKQIDITEKIRLEEQYSIMNDNLKRDVVKKENIKLFQLMILLKFMII